MTEHQNYPPPPGQPQPGIAPVIPLGPQPPPGEWHIDPVTSQPVPGPAPINPPPWPPSPRPRAPWQRTDADTLPPSGMLADVAADHPVRWLLVPAADGGIDLHLTQLLMPADDMPAAGMISEMAGSQFRHVVASKTWNCWNGHWHARDKDDFMRRVVQGFAATYQDALVLIEAQAKRIATAEAMKAAEQARGRDATDVAKETDKRYGQVMDKVAGFLKPQLAYGKHLLNDPVQERVYKQLAKKLGTDGSEYDRDSSLVNFADYTYELLTGQYREHRWADKLTSGLAYPFIREVWEKPWEHCPKYMAMMKRLSGGEGELLVYNIGVESLGLIRGNPGEHLFIRHGGSEMGKSVCNEVTGTLAGDLWYPAAPELIGVIEHKGQRRHPSVLATLEGTTYVTVDESDGVLVLDAGMLKMLVSSKFMPATELYHGRQQRLDRSWTIVGNANTGQLPTIPRLDSGLERRIRVIPVPESELATRLTDRYAEVIVAEEGAAIASLLIMRAAQVLREGLPEPQAVTDATEAYFDRCDPRRVWLRSRIRQEPGSVISSSQAWEVFRRDTWQSWVTQTDFSLLVQARGYEIRKDPEGRMMIQNAAWIG